MQKLKDRILNEGKVFPGNIVKVDSFLNHRLDTQLLYEMGQAISHAFPKPDVILTIEASGIALAMMTAIHGNIPVVFAKKGSSKLKEQDAYQTQVHSTTKDVDFTVSVARPFLLKNQKVLIIDDFLAHGEAVFGLMDLVKQAQAEVIGVGIAVEKGFLEGGQRLRDAHIPLVSLAIVDDLSEGRITLR